MGYWTFGLGMIHGCVCVFVTWGALKIMYNVRLAMFLSKVSRILIRRLVFKLYIYISI